MNEKQAHLIRFDPDNDETTAKLLTAISVELLRGGKAQLAALIGGIAVAIVEEEVDAMLVALLPFFHERAVRHTEERRKQAAMN